MAHDTKSMGHGSGNKKWHIIVTPCTECCRYTNCSSKKASRVEYLSPWSMLLIAVDIPTTARKGPFLGGFH